MISYEQLIKRFDWIPIYKELAQKLLNYKNNRKELLNIIKRMQQNNLKCVKTVDRDKNNNKIELRDIDPFTFYGNFNMNATVENRIATLRYIKDALKLEASLPTNFDGIPISNAQKLWYFAYERDRDVNDLNKLWNLFEKTLLKTDISQEFDDCLKINQVRYNLTTGLYWIDPDTFMPCDTNTRDYLTQQLHLPPNYFFDFSYKVYVDILDMIKQDPKLSNFSYPEISYVAIGGELDSPQVSIENTTRIDERLSKNTILYGPPGTGKTYHTKELALKLIGE